MAARHHPSQGCFHMLTTTPSSLAAGRRWPGSCAGRVLAWKMPNRVHAEAQEMPPRRRRGPPATGTGDGVGECLARTDRRAGFPQAVGTADNGFELAAE